jgi:predicted DNA-binding transcriptional regulator AlpA
MEAHHSVSAFAGASAQHLPFIYLQLRAVSAAVSLSQSRIYALIKAGEFPRGDLIGAQSRRWKSTDIAAWLTEQSEKAAKREADLAAALKRKSQKAVATKAQKSAAREVNHVQG